ncbi:MAG: tellurite resistance/C4-dicarboxylate transporter family protein [Proteobacteria bacterium]|nr:tellurite resistance/C4-dicarboxylate transporter family protein [Pseudomonadota bacterium]
MNVGEASERRARRAGAGGVLAGLVDLSPAYFAMVMATGIVSLAAHQHGLERIALGLFWIAGVAWALLWCMNTLRMLVFPRRFYGDMVDHMTGPGYFTSVAATAVLGAQCVILAHRFWFGAVLLALAYVLWLVLTYTVFAAMIVKDVKPTLDKGISGAWLLAVVATQSLAVVGALLAAQAPQPWRLALNFFALAMWLWGGMQYIWMVSLIFYRDTFFHFAPADLTPPHWISMGAMAISTLVGALLIENAGDAPMLRVLTPFLMGFMVFYWATGTWWVPMMIVLDVWSYVYKRFPFRYDPLDWGAVFPLGMYSVCSYDMAHVLALDFLWPLPVAFLVLALLAWVAAFAGLLRRIVQWLRSARVR